MLKPLLAVLAALACCAAQADAKSLKPFANDAELQALFAKWTEEYKKLAEERRRLRSEMMMQMAPLSGRAAAPAAKSADAAESITNVQHAGVDEGGIVKRHGDHLVILRRGRLFTVRIGGDALVPVATVDAFGPGIEPRGAWYDEMLIHGDTVVVIGYSYQRGGTEIGLFDIRRDGALAHRGTHHLRSNDYYSSRNYASRLIGSKLVFYSPLFLNPARGDLAAQLPAHREWGRGDFQRIAPATRIYRTDDELDGAQGGIALHTVSICDLAAAQFRCESTAVLGRPGRVFYVSPDSVFVWTTDWRRRGTAAPASSVFRIPLDGGAPTGLKVAGAPVDQLSFLHADGHLNVLVRAEGGGEGMWRAEARPGDLAFLRVPLARFGDGTDGAEQSLYTPLPAVEGGAAIQNRYVGDYLLYGAGAGWRRPRPVSESTVHALRFASDQEVFRVALPHGVDRIESLGGHAIVIGSDGKDLSFTSLRLTRTPVVIDRYVQLNAAQGETRTHGFFYRVESAFDGWVGLPVIGGSEAAAGQLKRTAAQVVFLRNESLRLRPIGALEARAGNVQDACRASCVDWYGNARPIFIGARVFALLGYEIVEGKLGAERITEARRVTFAPAQVGAVAP